MLQRGAPFFRINERIHLKVVAEAFASSTIKFSAENINNVQ